LAKRIGGTTPWIENGKQTGKIVDAKQAFGDSVQAAAQVAFFDAHGDPQQRRLARLAYQQFQGKRLRGPNKAAKPVRAAKAKAKKVAKPRKSGRKS
jgi:phage I-like protein